MSGRRHWHNEDGQALVVSVLFMIVLLGFLGLAMDVGNGMLQKRRLQAAVDLGLLSGAQDMPSTSSATTDANNLTTTDMQKGLAGANVTENTTTGCQVSGCSSPDKISMTATVTVPTYFLKLFGVSHWTISASGSACGPCDTSAVKYDVVVVLDRSYSMCTDDNGDYNGCTDLQNAVAGIKSLENFFSPTTDRLSLVLLSSEDDVAPFSHTGSAAPCDTANVSDASVRGKGMFYKSVGDFMDGTASSHDDWVVAPLNSNFKNSDGSLNTSSQFNSTLNCVQSKGWTPIAPAVQAATQELQNNGRSDAQKVIIYFGDGGANVQPQKRDSNGNATGQTSWYTPTAGNNDEPCHDAVAQAQIAKSDGIKVYTIGYDLSANGANQCSHTDQSPEAGITAQEAMQQMASASANFYQQASSGQVYQIFDEIGHSITSGGERLTS